MRNDEGDRVTTGLDKQAQPMNRRTRRLEQHREKTARDRRPCPFPDCGKSFVVIEGQPNVCPEHRKMINDVVFIVNRIRRPQVVEPEPTAEQFIKESVAEAAKKGE